MQLVLFLKKMEVANSNRHLSFFKKKIKEIVNNNYDFCLFYFLITSHYYYVRLFLLQLLLMDFYFKETKLEVAIAISVFHTFF